MSKRTIKLFLPPLTAIACLYAMFYWNAIPDDASLASSSIDDKGGASHPAAPKLRPVRFGHGAGGEVKGTQRNILSSTASPFGYRHCTDKPGSEPKTTGCHRSHFAAASSAAPGQLGDENSSVELRQTLDGLKEDLLENENPLAREQAINELAEIGGREAYSVISGALADPDIQVRRLVIEKLGKAGHDQFHVLGQVLFTEPDPELRRQTVEIIAAQQGPAAMALLQLALQDPDDEVMLLAAAWLNDSAWVEEVEADADSHGEFDSEARIAAIRRVHLQDPGQAIAFLSDVVRQDPDPYVREEAVFALAAMGGDDSYTAVAGALGDDDVPVRELAMHLLAGADEGKTLPLLGQVLFNDPNPALRRQAIEIIAEQEGPAAWSLLEAAVKDRDEGVSLAASQVLSRRP